MTLTSGEVKVHETFFCFDAFRINLNAIVSIENALRCIRNVAILESKQKCVPCILDFFYGHKTLFYNCAIRAQRCHVDEPFFQNLNDYFRYR